MSLATPHEIGEEGGAGGHAGPVSGKGAGVILAGSGRPTHVIPETAVLDPRRIAWTGGHRSARVRRSLSDVFHVIQCLLGLSYEFVKSFP